MNGHKLLNGLIILSLLLPTLLTGNPTPTRAAPEAARADRAGQTAPHRDGWRRTIARR